MENGDGGTTQVAQEASTPQYIGNYEVLKTIGKGKFAVVYRAKKVDDDQVVALKRISVDMMNEKAREKCLKEVRLLQNLDHPNIIRYMDSFITENDLIIVYEWAAAGDLKRQLRKAQEKGVGFDERVIWKYFSQICMAIQHMHEKRIMHRDLKPANIFLTLDGTIKVGDLGLSRELSEHTIQAHSKVGTPLYMSPEVLKGDGYDFKSDVWSLGCLLYELAMLKSPFKAEGLNLYSLFQKISNGEYQPLPEDGYSEELRQLAYSMISIKPEDRPEINEVVAIAKRMRQQTANQKSSTTKQITTATAEFTRTGAPSTPDGDTRKPVPNGGGLVRTPSRTALEAKEAALQPRDGKETNPFGKRPDSNDSRFAPDADRDRPLSRDVYEDGVAGGKNQIGLADYFQYKNQQEDEQEETRPRTYSYDPPDAYNQQRQQSAEDKSRSEAHQKQQWRQSQRADVGNDGDSRRAESGNQTTTSARTKSINDRIEDSPLIQQPISSQHVQQQSISSSALTQQGVVRRTKPPLSSKTSNTDTNAAASAMRSSNNRPNSGKYGDAESDGEGVSSRERSQSTTQRAQLASNPEEIAEAGQAMAIMEVVYTKLIMLQYPMDDPNIKQGTRDYRSRGRLLPLHFACDAKALGSIAGQDRGYAFNAFSRFVHVVQFLCPLINPQAAMAVEVIDKEFGAPMTAAKQILQAAQV